MVRRIVFPLTLPLIPRTFLQRRAPLCWMPTCGDIRYFHHNECIIIWTNVPRKIFILIIKQLDAQNFCSTVSLFHSSTCFEHHVLIIRRSKLYYTSSGIITLCRWPSGAQVESPLNLSGAQVESCLNLSCAQVESSLNLSGAQVESSLNLSGAQVESSLNLSCAQVESSLNLCTGRPPTGVTIPDAE